MDISRTTLKRAGQLVGYFVLGLVGTGAIALGLLYVSQPIQTVIYDLVYLWVGPSEATETAILTHFVTVGVLGLSLTMLLGDYLSDRLVHREQILKAIGGLVGLIVVFLGIALAGYAAFLTALLVLAVAFLGIPLILRYRYDIRSGSVPAFLGGIPVLVLLLLLVGFGLGWGWGYVITAQEVPVSAVDDATAVTFDDVPEVRDDLFAADNCEAGTDDRRVCRLYLRGYEHEAAAARFLARHGVRCPYQNARAPASPETFVARHDGTYYRISCAAHGD